MTDRARSALIMAGGTGGHVYPALAVALALREEGWKVTWLGTRAGMEARIVPEHGFDMAWISFAGVRGKGMLRKLLLPVHLLRAFWQAARAIFRLRPDAAVGLGGYVAFPGGMMASLLGKPLIIHEQNAIGGLTNRVLACLADRVLLGLPAAFSHKKDRPLPCGKVSTEWVGNPLRPEITHLPVPADRYAARTGPLRLLVVGGSLGAVTLNSLIPEALALLPESARPEVRHQSGQKNLDQLQANYRAAGVAAECLAFITDMAAAYAWADVVICRAGASTVSELAGAGVPAALVPFPSAVDDHQTANAQFLADSGAAWLMPQSTLSPDNLAIWLKGLNRTELQGRAEKARALAKAKATERVLAIIKEVTQ